VDEYQSQFEILYNKITRLSEDFRVSKFLSGHKEEVRIIVTMLKPTSLLATFGVAPQQTPLGHLKTMDHPTENC
jgi:hypothetical protein